MSRGSIWEGKKEEEKKSDLLTFDWRLSTIIIAIADVMEYRKDRGVGAIRLGDDATDNDTESAVGIDLIGETEPTDEF
jgi:hypothetical protein